ncbi:hypothetical protein GCM10027449_15320 [Sinomonas notoginsengisoli]
MWVDPGFDVVADGAGGVDALAGRVLEFPVLVALAGEVTSTIDRVFTELADVRERPSRAESR